MSSRSNKEYGKIALRVTANSQMGSRRYQEDQFSVAYQRTKDGSGLEFSYIAIFDGHGGDTAAKFAKEHLMNFIVDEPGFWSEDDADILQAIKTGFINCHMAMWRDLDNWPRTNSGLPSTAGTTASIAFIRKEKLYIGHAGDSGIVLAEQAVGRKWRAKPLTVDHKPESDVERKRIEACGGKVMEKQGIHRVVWYRPKYPHQGPIRRNTVHDEVPFLAVARSLGDLWSYNVKTEKFMVSPEPDVSVYDISTFTDKCLIFASDGLWNIMDAQMAVDIVAKTEAMNESNARTGLGKWTNPSHHLVEVAMHRWREQRLRSDNTTVICVMLDAPSVTNSIFNNMDREQNDRTIYDYSTSEAYSLDYTASSYESEMYSQQNYDLMASDSQQQINPFHFYNADRNITPLPPFSTNTYESYSQSSSSLLIETPTVAPSPVELTYHTSSNESAFVKGCCPIERFMLARSNEQINYHASYEQHREMYQNMSQQPLPPLHYAYRPVPTYGILPSMSDNSFNLPSQNVNVSARPMERYNYLRPTEAEIEQLHKANEAEEYVSDTDEMEWSDDEEEEVEKADENQESNVINNNNEAETISSSDLTNEIIDQINSDDSIQIFEISSSNLGINEKESNEKKMKKSNNKENSESPVRKKKANKSTIRYYETRQTNRKMRSGNICALSGHRVITKEKNRRISKFAKKAIKTLNELKSSTSAALKKLESISLIKATTSASIKHKVTEKGHDKSPNRILRSSQMDIKKAVKEVIKVNVVRNLRSNGNAVLNEKPIQRKRTAKMK